MTFFDALSLFFILLFLASIPGTSVALVVVRSSLHGVKYGIVTALGIVTGDMIFILIAMLGLTALSQQLGALFIIFRYLAALYLIGIGLQLLISKKRNQPDTNVSLTPHHTATSITVTSFLSGLLVTLSDIKAILFYASLFPAFIDVSALQSTDIILITAIRLVAVSSAKISYAVGAHKVIKVSQTIRCQHVIKMLSGSFMIASGGYILTKP